MSAQGRRRPDRPVSPGREAPAPSAAAPSCTVALCPICAVVTGLGEAAPELAAHLAVAGRELLLALRSLIDARLQTLDAPEPATRLERVTLEPG